MTRKELEEIRNWEYVLLQIERAAECARKKLINAFKVRNIKYNAQKDELCFIRENKNCGFTGARIEELHHIDEMIQNNWICVEEDEVEVRCRANEIDKEGT